MIRVGLVGYGMAGRVFHGPLIAAVPGIAIAKVASGKPEAVRADLGDVSIMPTAQALIADAEIDLVVVATPTATHAALAIAALQAGKHVVVEKPLEVTVPRCDAIIDACDAAGVRLCAIFPSRFSAANVALKAAIDAGRFGRLTLGDTYVKWWRTQDYYDSGKWRGTWDLDGGGALMNQAIHNVDLLGWLMGEVHSVQAMTATLAHDRIEVKIPPSPSFGSAPEPSA